MHFAIVKQNATFENGDLSVLLKVGTQEEVETRGETGELVSMVITKSAWDAGLCVGARGELEGEIEESSTLKDDGNPFLRLRPAKGSIRVTRKGNQAVGVEDIVFD